MSTVRRAAPLSPDARRASIIAATVPLLRRHGAQVTTAQIAMASGIAEGTLFRVFPDKESLIAAAIASAFDPSPTVRELAAVDRSLDLREQLICAVEILQRRVEGVWQLMSMMGMSMPPRDGETAKRAMAERMSPGGADPSAQQIAQMFESHRSELRCEPFQAARMLRIMTFAGTHPRIAEGIPLTAAEIVAVVLDGVRVRSDLDSFVEAPC